MNGFIQEPRDKLKMSVSGEWLVCSGLHPPPPSLALFQVESSHAHAQLPTLTMCDSQTCLHSSLPTPEMELLLALSSLQGLTLPHQHPEPICSHQEIKLLTTHDTGV